jgi:hypothetical protein
MINVYNNMGVIVKRNNVVQYLSGASVFHKSFGFTCRMFAYLEVYFVCMCVCCFLSHICVCVCVCVSCALF